MSNSSAPMLPGASASLRVPLALFYVLDGSEMLDILTLQRCQARAGLKGLRADWIAPDAESAHTAAMTLKNAAFLALIGTLVLTILVAAEFVITVLGVVRELIPAMALLRSLVYLFAAASVTVFFFVFHKQQPR